MRAAIARRSSSPPASCSPSAARRRRWTTSPRAPGSASERVYRHFPTKEALLTELVAEVFRGFTAHAVRAQDVDDPWTAFEGMLRDCLTSMERDAAGRDAIMRTDDLIWEGVEADKAALNAATQIVIDRAIADGSVRPDFSAADVGPLMCGITATMHYMGAASAWQRQLDIMLAGVRAR